MIMADVGFDFDFGWIGSIGYRVAICIRCDFIFNSSFILFDEIVLVSRLVVNYLLNL